MGSCEACPIGRWSSIPGRSDCEACSKGTYRGLSDTDGCISCEGNEGWWCDELALGMPKSQPGYFVDTSGTSNISIVPCVPFRACLGMCNAQVQVAVGAQLDAGVLTAAVDTSECSGGHSGISQCSDGYRGRRCGQCTPYTGNFCEGGAERAYYRLDELCEACPCGIWTFRVLLGLLFMTVVGMMLVLDLFSQDATEHSSTLAAPFLILVTFCQTMAL